MTTFAVVAARHRSPASCDCVNEGFLAAVVLRLLEGQGPLRDLICHYRHSAGPCSAKMARNGMAVSGVL